jgi:hypothetical protein
MLRLLPSDPLYPEWSQLLTDYAALLNPRCFWNLADVDTDAAEYKAAVAEWRGQVAEMFEELTR